MTHPDPQHQDPADNLPENPETDEAQAAADLDGAEEDAAGDDAGADSATESAEARADRLEQELADLKDKALRALAEAENTRRRSQRDREDTAKFAVSGFARDMLSVADNLQRALEAIKPEQRAASPELENIYVGVDATARELLRVFAANGIKKIEAMGNKFDPNMHEVLFEVEMPGSVPGTIVQVMEPGYTIHERLLRPARVGVAKGGEEAAHAVDEEI
ncbi:MAG: nucleotide exchange factor GrpE [Alphaproteobacteria bacterium]|nr:nucleotide exchange factor GrpE [Alphaproteobacteria bacterium]